MQQISEENKEKLRAGIRAFRLCGYYDLYVKQNPYEAFWKACKKISTDEEKALIETKVMQIIETRGKTETQNEEYLLTGIGYLGGFDE
jgi:hypothetical protein